MSRNPKVFIVALLVVLVIVLGFYQSHLVGQAASEVTCAIDFEATIHTGPSAGVSMQGELVLYVDPVGSAIGILTQAEGDEVNVVGQVNGRAINIVLELDQASHIFGVGTLTNNFSECSGHIGGPFAGPKSGDLGDWGYAIGGNSVKIK